MIRSRFVLTRLIVVIAVIALLSLGLGPVVSYVTVRGLESATGAKVEIGQTQVELYPSPRIRFTDFAVADPRDEKAMRDAFRAETIELTIDGNAMLHRRWVASYGEITGLEIGSRRATSGHYAPVEEELEQVSDSPSMLSQLLGAAVSNVGDQAGEFANDLETVRRSKEIRSRWESEYQSLVVRARNLEKQIRPSATKRGESRTRYGIGPSWSVRSLKLDKHAAN